ncbi:MULTISPECIES: phospho-sugar mutase [Halanaerobium]|uniref:Phosphoglucomutase n=2 Tax=Halanaerobium TaxID=2330 RepID=A0A4R6S180_9FIRM|nr:MULTISPECIES: phospho-sugar mutase [Halanaerobium]KXS48888.1 MAG: phosphoglucomutase [Halanaerobium sp. T82-1]SIR33889.1 alpha-phosphoglucomutase [Halanaerobium kushneri]PUU91234.1 MAG: phosphoglucomutase [Halanaerobium sp.]PUU95522.1 MAG: phosphoglucomutase [Halanaerobium sp.]RCW58592.1 alpha-phosphoglucomutase [Halanaerobium sp. ST460_2HS_T2]
MSYMSRYRDWLLSDYFDKETKEELEAIQDDEAEIEDRFYKNIDFGTGGMRGKMGAGTNRINKYVIRKATQGLANYIINYSDDGQEKGVVIAYDSRHNSPEFSLEAALVLAANGIKTYLFTGMRATPELSYAVRELDAIGGIVVTASHNPPEYNGYKVYWEDGGQVVPEQARDIIAEIEEIDDFSIVKTMDEMEAVDKGLLNYIGAEVDDSYQKTLIDILPDTDLAAEKGSNLSVVYTPLHGTGSTVIPKLLSDLGFSNLHLVEEQSDGDSEFSTVESPNPEDREAFDLALKLAEEEEADLVIATDPDCDRMAPAVRDAEGNYQFLNGNETGVLFADFLLKEAKAAGKLPDNGVIVKSIVSTDMVLDIAAEYGVEVLDVLTGFKFIGEKITEFEASGEKEFILGFEESLGYLIGKHARDKDAAVAAGLAAIMALKYKEEGTNLLERLAELREEFGYYLEDLESIRLEGKEGQEVITKTIARLREESPEKIAGRRVKVVKDYKLSTINYLDENQEEEIKLPKSNVLQYLLEGDAKLTIRPSGTEPKLKFYFAVREKDQATAEKVLAGFKENLMSEVEEIMNSF